MTATKRSSFESERTSSPSHDSLENDRQILQEEEEREELIAPDSTLGRLFKGNHDPNSPIQRRELKKHKRRDRRKQRRRRSEEGGSLLYDTEESKYRDDSSSRSTETFEEKAFDQRLSRRTKLVHIFITPSVILLLLGLLSFGAYEMSNRTSISGAIRSNGTSNFAPTTLLISLDGFRADFLNRGLTPTLNGFIAEGVSPSFMLPSFPSVTFPNHYTLVTGLYPESHGVVGNTFWDPQLEEEFFYTDPARSMQAKWWISSGAEPIWSHAERQGVRSAIHMWPGSEAHLPVNASYVDKYNGTEELSRKVDKVLGFLDLPSEYDIDVTSDAKRPQFIAMYVPNVDQKGHLFGPNSTEIRQTIRNVDSMMNDLFQGLKERNLDDIVNVVVVSDHGMATTSNDRLIQLEDLIDPSLLSHIDGWPLFGLRPKKSEDIRSIYQDLSAKSADNPNFDVYLKEDMPKAWHFTNNERIAPLWIIPKTGWAIVKKSEFDILEAQKLGKTYHPRGIHGYDIFHPLMRAIFVARGPAFPHAPNSQVEVFQNTEVYNILCDSLGMLPEANNGTIRLPLNPIGFHAERAVEQAPIDPPEGFSSPNISKTTASVSASASVEFSSAVPFISAVPAQPPPPTPEDSETPERPTFPVDPGKGSPHGDDGGPVHGSLWNFLMEKLKAAKAWAHEILRGTTNSKSNDEAPS